MQNLVTKCRNIARQAHSGQFRRDGITEYIIHPITVAGKVAKFGYEYECVAYLHDVLEDTHVTAKDLLAQGVPSNIVEAVKLLTQEEGIMSRRLSYDGYYFDEYLYNIKNNELARRVKVADMLSNLGDNPTDKQIVKYAKGLVYLMAK